MKTNVKKMQNIGLDLKKKSEQKVNVQSTTSLRTTVPDTAAAPQSSMVTIGTATATTTTTTKFNQKGKMSTTGAVSTSKQQKTTKNHKFLKNNSNSVNSDSSISDEESVSEVDFDDEIPDSCSDSCEQEPDEPDDEEEEEDEDDEEEDEDDDEDDDDDEEVEHESAETDGEDLDGIDRDADTKRLEALFEAASKIQGGIDVKSTDKVPAIRNATLALDEAAQALNRMRQESNPRERKSLIDACADNDVNTVRKLLGDGNSTINEGTDDGESLLSLACSAGYLELAQVLLAMSAQVEDRGQKNDCTPLMEAASAGHVEIIRLLINHHADVNAQSASGNTPLMYACAGGHVDAVRELLGSGANVEDHNENGHTPLMEAASAGHVEVAKILLDYGAGINTHSNEFKESALTLACYKGHLDMVRFLLDAGADQEHKTDEMHTALMEASMDGHVEVARLLLDSGAQVNMPTDSFESPLTLAACGGHVDLAMLLIERGANIEEVNDEGYTPLMEAAREGHEEMVALLLAQGANINAQTEETQETALTLACCGGFLEVAEYLMKNGADIELGASTPLMETAQEGHIELVKFLLENRANVHAQTQTGDTALTYACENGHTDVAEVLLYYGAELEHESEGGRTPLMKACRAGHICTIKFLILKGADVNRQSTNNDHTPLSLACAGGHQQVVELLLKKNADPFHKLKDNSTMLIEASKGGHIGVVEMLLDYPLSILQSNEYFAAGAAAQRQLQQLDCLRQTNQQHLQQLQQQIPQQPVQQSLETMDPDIRSIIQTPLQQIIQSQEQYLVNAPPGLREVPEAVRVSNQQIFQQQLHQKDGDEAIAAQTLTLPNPSNPSDLTDINLSADANLLRAKESIITNQMRLIQAQGFKDGLAHGGLNPAQIAFLANNAPFTQVTPTNLTSPIPPVAGTTDLPPMPIVQPASIVKQRSLLRRIRPATTPAPFELNINAMDQQQTTVGGPLVADGDDSDVNLKIFEAIDKQVKERQRKMLDGFEMQMNPSIKKENIQLMCEGNNGTPSNIVPSAFVDITSAQSAKPPDNNNFVLTQTITPSQVQLHAAAAPVIQTPATSSVAPVTFATNLQLPPTTTTTTTTHLSAPSEVSQNTAISDRPKVKPVSKKDGKNLRKNAANVAAMQRTQMAPIPGEQKSFASLFQPVAQPSTTQPSLGHQPQNQVKTCQPQALQQTTIIQPTTASNNPVYTAMNAPLSDVYCQQMGTESDPIQSPNATPIVDDTGGDGTDGEAIGPNVISITNHQLTWNEKLYQMAQIPDHPWQKIVQRSVIDQPKSPSETPPTSSLSDPDMARIFCDMFRSEYNTNPLQKFVIQKKPCIQTNASNGNVHSGYLMQLPHEHEKEEGGSFISEDDNDLHMFTVDETDVYPSMSDSLDSFDANIVTPDGARWEWADDVIEVLHGVSEWPMTLQEVTANLTGNQTEIEHTNLFGLNAACKMRWTGGQWSQQQSQSMTAQHSIAADSRPDVDGQLSVDKLDCLTVDNELEQHIQPQLSVEQLELLSQFQAQQQQQQQEALSLLPSTVEQQLHGQNLALQSTLPQQTDELQAQLQNLQLSGDVQQNLSADGQQTKFVFNVDSDKTSPSLQLLFQLPQVQQGQPGQPPSAAIISTQTQSFCPVIPSYAGKIPTIQQMAQSNIVTTTQSQPQTIGTIQIPDQTLQLHQQQAVAALQQRQVCVQHSQQVQVATQTQQIQSIGEPILNTIGVDNQTAAVPVERPTVTMRTGTKKGAEKSRKDRNRYTVMRHAPACSQSATQTQKLPVLQALEKTIDVDSETDSNHDTALTLACAGGHEELVELLISRNANIEHRDKKGFTPLILAATAGHEKVVNTLLTHGAEIEAQSERTKDTPLSLACSGGRYEVVEILLSVGANKEHRNVSDYTPLSLAASGGYVNIIRLLLSHGAEINSRTGSKLGISPLMLAAMNGHTAAVKLLLDMGSDINAQIETNRNTALTLACFQGRHEVVSLLLDRKANVEHRAKTGLTPLMEAASGGYIEVGRVLLDKGADVNAAPVPSSRDTALTIAADKGHLKFVELLLSRGAAVEVKNKKGNSPLWLAANGGHLAVVKVLYNNDADIDSQDNRRVSCLMAAFRKGHTKVVEWMVNHVTQFPSDQEMTRYIGTVTDKELLEKCHDCVITIRAAKEAQAVKANKNASSLLEELDMERYREESRKAAAARRRERKKKKKLEKKEEKRKLLETNTDNPTKDSDKEDESDKEETNDPHQHGDKEEGDSGIDQGSCSSADAAKPVPVVEKTNKPKKNKNKKNNKERSVSPMPIVVESTSKKSGREIDRTKQKDLTVKPLETKPEPRPREIPTKPIDARRDVINDRRDQSIRKEKENVAPKEEARSMKTVRITDDCQKMKPAETSITSSHGSSARKSLFSSQRDCEPEIPTDSTYFNITKNKHNKNFHLDDSKVMASGSPKQPLQSTGKREEGWKEVIRKSSIQQQVVTVEISCKKVQVPTHAISRVIGRGGSNINAIRAATGAHIEVEKQGKNQNDRSITIKGSLDATKQAHSLITTLIKDPDVDILQMLPRLNANAKVTPPTNVWDRQTTIVSSTASTVPVPPPNPKGKSSLSASGSQKSSTVSSSTKSARSTTKTIYTSSQSRSVAQTSSHRTPTSGYVTGLNKTIIVTQSQASNTTKTTMSYTNAIMALKNTIKNSAGQSTGFSSTFAAKLSDKKPVTSQYSTTTALNSHISSPIKNQLITVMAQSTIPPPFISVNSTVTSTFAPMNAATTTVVSSGPVAPPTKAPFSQSSIDSTSSTSSTSNVRALTPIGQPLSRNVTPSPLFSTTNEIVNVAAAIQSTNLANQLQSKIIQLHQGNAQAHEYSLFNNSQWETKQSMFSTSSGSGSTFIENEALPQADAAKAPGYRGTIMSSPISSKTSSNSTTPPSSQQPPSTSGLHPSSIGPKSHVSPGQSVQSIGNSVSNQTFNSSAGDLASGGVPSSKSSQPSPIQPPASSSSLAVQRPNLSSNQRVIGSQLDSYGSIGSNQRPYYDLNIGRTSNNLMMAGFNQSIDHLHSTYQMPQQPIGSGAHNNPIQMSRLNPRASVFSSIQTTTGNGVVGHNAPGSKSMPAVSNSHHLQNQNYNSMFHQSMGGAGSVGGGGVGGGQNANNQMIPPPFLNNSQNYQQKVPMMPVYNQPIGRPQSQPQVNSNGRWMSDYLATPRDILSMENGLPMSLNSPAMSPNQTGVGGQVGVTQDDSKKIPRPIGMERSWKMGQYGMASGMGGDQDFVASNQQQPPWMMDKGQTPMHPAQQQQMPQQWMQPQHSMPRMTMDDLHTQDNLQLPFEYYPLSQGQPNLSLMQTLQYQQIMPTDMVQQPVGPPPQPGGIEAWEHEKPPTWATKWTN